MKISDLREYGGYVYLASPYSCKEFSDQNKNKEVEQARFEEICKIADRLIAENIAVYCPIAMSHPIHILGQFSTGGWEFWQHQDEIFINKASAVVVAKMEGWESSKGIEAEIKLASFQKIPVFFLDVNNWNLI